MATNYTDTHVTAGSTYEYQIVKAATLGYTGYGYIFCGIDAPLVEDRGKAILVVANTCAAALTNELARLQGDLIGDGWTVIRHNVATNASPASVRNLIIADYNADPTNVNTVFLFGHVPILHSGNLNYDTHLARPMPADAYYGDVNGDWSGSPDFLPSDVELMVGRVDMFDMPGNYAPIPWPGEVELLRNYLNKDHNWRHGLIHVPRRALMGDRRGAEGGWATAASGYRNFQPLLGSGATSQADVSDISPPQVRWGPMLAAGGYLWAYGCSAGSPSSVSELGTRAPYDDLWSIDIVEQNATAVFVMVFGSWFGNWDATDNLMRAFLAAPALGLTSCMAGEPHWFVHHMGLGETIGYGTRLSMNNSTLYRNKCNIFTRAIYISLMGDPTLRMDPVSPPATLTAAASDESVDLSWSASPDPVLGYDLYRSDSPEGPFLRLNGQLIGGTSFTDASVAARTYTYMVRAVTLQATPSGTYTNSSQGIFTTIDTANPLSAWSLYFQNRNGRVAVWSMRGAERLGVADVTPRVGAEWRVMGLGDFGGRGGADLLWQSTDGGVAVWFMDGTRCLSSSRISPWVESRWRIVGNADFNGDGKRDILWQNSDGTLAVWLMNGASRLGGSYILPKVDASWKVVGTGDFDRDGQSDLLWQNGRDGSLAVWLMNGATRTGVAHLTPPRVEANWQIVGTVDMNGDGQTTILWQDSSGYLAYWQMNGISRLSSGRLNPGWVDPAWRIVGAK